jgi:hypothetical protein
MPAAWVGHVPADCPAAEVAGDMIWRIPWTPGTAPDVILAGYAFGAPGTLRATENEARGRSPVRDQVEAIP